MPVKGEPERVDGLRDAGVKLGVVEIAALGFNVAWGS
jgi:hypothetical protein